MALNSGNVGEKAVVRDLKMYTGILPWKVIAINPNLEQLKAFGLNFQEEPEYKYDPESTDGARVKGIRIDIWLETKLPDNDQPFRSKVSFYLENQYRKSQDGSKNEYINAFGKTAWSTPDTLPEFDWYDKTGVRKSFVGEEGLMNFLINWMNVAPNVPVSIEDFDKLVQGDLTELTSLLPIYGETNRIHAMLTVTEKDKKMYHSVFNKFFTRWNEESATKWQKFFQKDSRNEPKNAHWSYELKVVKPVTPTPDADAAPDAEGQATNAAKKNNWR